MPEAFKLLVCPEIPSEVDPHHELQRNVGTEVELGLIRLYKSEVFLRTLSKIMPSDERWVEQVNLILLFV